MRDQADRSAADYQSVRGDAQPTIANFIRWERIKLRQAAQDAIRLLEESATPTREYLDYMFETDIRMKEIRSRLHKHQSRIDELELIQSAATLA